MQDMTFEDQMGMWEYLLLEDWKVRHGERLMRWALRLGLDILVNWLTKKSLWWWGEETVFREVWWWGEGTEVLIFLTWKVTPGQRFHSSIFTPKFEYPLQGPELPLNHHDGHSTIYQDTIFIIDNPDYPTVFSIPVTMLGDWKKVTQLVSIPKREVYPAPVVSPNLLGC